jgi:hypothetical protein
MRCFILPHDGVVDNVIIGYFKPHTTTATLFVAPFYLVVIMVIVIVIVLDLLTGILRKVFGAQLT